MLLISFRVHVCGLFYWIQWNFNTCTMMSQCSYTLGNYHNMNLKLFPMRFRYCVTWPSVHVFWVYIYISIIIPTMHSVWFALLPPTLPCILPPPNPHIHPSYRITCIHPELMHAVCPSQRNSSFQKAIINVQLYNYTCIYIVG